jgi:hypothetical protein
MLVKQARNRIFMRFIFIIGLAHEQVHFPARCISAIFSIAVQFCHSEISLNTLGA